MRDRQIEILNSLVGGRTVLIKELSHTLDVSSRTIRNDLADINFELKQLSIPEIDNHRGNLSLSLTSAEKNRLLHYSTNQDDDLSSPKERQLEIILDFLNYPKERKILEEQEKVCISKSTMDNDMRQIRDYLKSYSLNLDTQQGAEIIGDERSIRNMIQDLINKNINSSEFSSHVNHNKNESHKLIINFFGENILSQSKTFAHNLIAGGKYDGVSARELQITFALATWIKRIGQQNYINEDKGFLPPESDKITSSLNALLTDLNLSAPTCEKRYVYYVLQALIGDKEDTIATWGQSQLLSLNLINFMTEKENIDYKGSERLFEQLNSHIADFMKRQQDHINIYNPLTATLKENYGRIFQDIQEFFTTNYKFKVSEDELAFITVYFGTYYEQATENNNRYRIAVLCNYGEATGQLLATSISQNLNVEIVAVLGLQDVSSIEKLNIDFVVKTINYPLEDIPSYKLSPVLHEKDYIELRKFANRLDIKPKSVSYHQSSNNENDLLKNIIKIIEDDTGKNANTRLVDDLISVFRSHDMVINESVVRPMIQDLLTDEKIQVHIEAKNWTDAIEKAAKPLLDSGSINEDYIAAMEESVRKFGAYIVIGPGIALAHARPEDGVSKLDVSVATLKQGINFGSKENDPVKVIFVLSAIDSYSHLNILKGIINLINQPGKIDELAEADNIKDFKEILFKEEKKEK